MHQSFACLFVGDQMRDGVSVLCYGAVYTLTGERGGRDVRPTRVTTIFIYKLYLITT